MRDGRYESTPLGRTTSGQMLRIATAHALERWLGKVRLGDDADTLEERVLHAVCEWCEEWGDELSRPDESRLSAALIAYDGALRDWEPGRLRALGIAICAISAIPLTRFGMESDWTARHEVQNDLGRLLRFVARRSLDRTPSAPHLALAAADLAASLEYGVADRGAAALLEAIRRGYPADDRRRRLTAEGYARLRAIGVESLDGALPHLSPDGQRFAALRPVAEIRLQRDRAMVLAQVPALPHGGSAHLRIDAPTQRSRWAGSADTLPDGGTFAIPGLRLAADGPAQIEVELVAIGRNPLLWRHAATRAAVTVEAGATGVRQATAGGAGWRVLERYATCSPRRLPLARHLAQWQPPPAAAGERCPTCGAPMRERVSGRGAFLGCSRYPDCTATLPR